MWRGAAQRRDEADEARDGLHAAGFAAYRGVRRTLRSITVKGSARVGAVLVSVMISRPLAAKCARLALMVSGEVRNDPGQELTIRLETVPDANERQEAPVRDGHRFTARLLFDPTKGYSRLRGHDCSRDPSIVRLLLLHGEDVRQKKELSFDKDFIEKSAGVYEVREAIVLDGQSDPDPR